ncbi:MAG: GGDEF domain-containing protein [Lachnospiraceae bacterium]|nr:GGDEF domain-containing protein [Lachnospiraceae bacterium]
MIMYSNGLKTIAVLVTEMQTQSLFQRVVCKHISEQAYKLGYNVAIFNWNNPYGEHKEYFKGELEIFDLADMSSYDAVIYLKDTFDNPEIEQDIEKKVHEKVTGPCVSLRTHAKDFCNILIDESAGIKEIVKHFIEVHGCKKIAFMTGKIEMLGAQLRLAAYKETMEEYGLEYDESYIFYGDYWKNKAGEAVDHYEASHYGMPEAIVCANDYMALAVMQELIERGYRIPDDILISGFDNINDAEDYIPSLTSLDVPLDVMAKEAVCYIHEQLNGKKSSDDIMIVPRPVLRNSCGCGKRDDWNIIRKKGRDYLAKSDNAYTMRDMRFFTIALEGISNLNELTNVVDRYMGNVGGYRDFFMCLNIEPDGDLTKPYPSCDGYTENMLCSLAIKDRIKVEANPKTFERKFLIPPEYTTEEPQIYYFTPLHCLTKNYGYTAISYSDYYGLQGDYYSFSTYISNALDTFNDKVILQRTLEKMEQLSVTDVLTGLYNRRGFEIKSTDIYEDCVEKNVPAMIVCIDMDGLKYINDIHGHSSGDKAIRTLAKALCYASGNKEVCARVGGDEFCVIAGDYSQEEMDDFVRKVFEYLDNYNKNAGNSKYQVSASCGAMLIDNHNGESLEYYINLCDKYMYEDKEKKKVAR